MKKISACILAIVLCFCLAACKDSSEGSNPTLSDSADSSISVSSNGVSDEVTVKPTEAWTEVDVDLTALSSTMVYSEVYNMMSTPDKYVGKVVKMRGNFALYSNQTGDTQYYAVVIADATACCQQGLEFIWTGNHSYPVDYPELNTEVEITGVFQTYLENGQTFCHIITDDLKVC